MSHRAVWMSLALVVAAFSSANAAEPYRKWMDYFEGGWTAETAEGQKDEVVFSYVPGKYAMIGKRTGATAATQLVGWRPDRKVMVDTHYGASGGYSVVEYAEFGDKTMKGVFTSFSNEDGDFTGAKVVVEIVDQDTAKVRITKGDVLDLNITYRRKK